MEAQAQKTTTAGLINKTIPMDQSMITNIHQIMKHHLDVADTPMSFGEAARRLIKAGLETKEKTG